MCVFTKGIYSSDLVSSVLIHGLTGAFFSKNLANSIRFNSRNAELSSG